MNIPKILATIAAVMVLLGAIFIFIAIEDRPLGLTIYFVVVGIGLSTIPKKMWRGEK